MKNIAQLPWVANSKNEVVALQGWVGVVVAKCEPPPNSYMEPAQVAAHARYIAASASMHRDLVMCLGHMVKVFNQESIDPMQAFVVIERAQFLLDQCEERK